MSYAKKFWWAVVVLVSFTVSAAVPHTMNYQGKLFESGGPITGTRAVGYRLYKDINGNHQWDDGTDSLVWEQIPADVSINDGLFSDTLDFSTGYVGGYDFEGVFGSGADLFLRVYVGPAGTYSDFTGTVALSPVENLRSAPYAFYAENAASVGNLEDGTSPNQTLRWDGSKWAASSALQNDGTNVTLTGDLRVAGNDIYGESGVSSNLYIRSDHGVRIDLDDNNDGTATFAIRNGGDNLVFEVTEGGNVSADGNGDFNGNLTLSGASGRQLNFSGGAGDITSTSGLDIIIDSDADGTGSEFVVKKDGSSNLFSVPESGTPVVYAHGTGSGETGGIRFRELDANGSNYVGFKAPDALGSNYMYTLPATDGTAGQVLTTDGSGNLSWSSVNNDNIHDADNDTRVTTENSPDEDYIRFFTAGVERGNISNTGSFWLGGPTYITADLHIQNAGSDVMNVVSSSGNMWNSGNYYTNGSIHLQTNGMGIYGRDGSGTDQLVFVPFKGDTTLINIPGNDLKFRDSGGNMVLQLTGGTDQLVWAWGSVVDANAGVDNLGSDANYFNNLYLDGQIIWKGTNDGVLQTASLTADRTWTLPDASGTIALRSDIPVSDNYQYWTVSDGSNSTDITSTATLTFAGSGGITTSLSGNTLTIDGSGLNDGDWQVSGSDMYSVPSGNVGIGITSPSQKLEVAGNVLATAFKGTGNYTTTWAGWGNSIWLERSGHDAIFYLDPSSSVGFMLGFHGTNDRIYVGRTTDGWSTGEYILSVDGSSLSLNMMGHNIVNLANPANAQDAATKAYVDSVAPQDDLSDNYLNDLADVNASAPSSGQVLSWDGSNWVASDPSGIDGSGSTNYLSKWTGSTTLGNSQIYDNGTNVGVGTASPSYKLDVSGNIRATGVIYGNTRVVVNTKSVAIPANTEKWIRVAVSDASARRQGGLFVVRWEVGGQHGHILFYAGADFGNEGGIALNVLAVDNYGNLGIDSIRVLENGTYDSMYVEVFADNNNTSSAMTVYVDQLYRGNNGWNLIDIIDGSLPSGYAAHTISTYTSFAVNEDSKVFTVEKNGNVGIGTSSPSYLLDVNGDVHIAGSLVDGSGSAGTSGQLLQSTGSGIQWVDAGSINDGDWQISGSDMYSVPSGNVGIGTTSPAYKLEVLGQARVGTGADLTPDASGTGYLMFRGNAYTGFVSMDGSAMYVGHNSSLRRLDLMTDETSRLSITGSGNVGIGTTSPAVELEVDGRIWADYDGDLSSNTTWHKFRAASDPDKMLGMGYDYADDFSFIRSWEGGVGDKPLWVEANPTVFIGGNVGVGTTSPVSILTVGKTTSGTPELTIQGNSTSYHNAAVVLKAYNSDANYRALGMYMYDNSGGTEWFIGRPYAGSDRFVINRQSGLSDHNRSTADDASYNLFTVLNNGNVGIGINNPGYKLDVQGNGRFTGTLTIGDYTLPNTDGTAGQVLVTDGSGNVSWEDLPDSGDYIQNLGGIGVTPQTGRWRLKWDTAVGSSTDTLTYFLFQPSSWGTDAIVFGNLVDVRTVTDGHGIGYYGRVEGDYSSLTGSAVFKGGSFAAWDAAGNVSGVQGEVSLSKLVTDYADHNATAYGVVGRVNASSLTPSSTAGSDRMVVAGVQAEIRGTINNYTGGAPDTFRVAALWAVDNSSGTAPHYAAYFDGAVRINNSSTPTLYFSNDSYTRGIRLNGNVLQYQNSSGTWVDLGTGGGIDSDWRRSSNYVYSYNSSDSVGIGTATPKDKFHVAGKIRASGTIYSMSDSAGYAPATELRTWGIDKPCNNDGVDNTHDNLYLEFGDADEGKFYITDHWNRTRPVLIDAGNVGIGNLSNPSAKLHVLGSSNPILYVQQSASSGADAGVKIRGSRNGCTTCDVAYIDLSDFDDNEGTSGTEFVMARIAGGMNDASGTTGYLRFYTNSGSGLVEAMRIDKNGRVGIGTTSPSSKLTVVAPTTSGWFIGSRFSLDWSGYSGSMAFAAQISGAKSSASSSGRSGGLLVTAGNATNGYNAALVARLIGDNYGAAVIAGQEDDWSIVHQTDILGKWAFYAYSPSMFKDTIFIGDRDAYLYQDGSNNLMFRDPNANGGTAVSLSDLLGGAGSDNDWRRNGNYVYAYNTNDSVGIGTNSPVDKLEVYGGGITVSDGTDQGFIDFRRDRNDVRIFEDSYALNIQGVNGVNIEIDANNNDYGAFRIKDRGTTVFYVDDVNHRVGIGTDSPSEQLHVLDPSGSSAIFLGGNGTGGPHGIVFDDDTPGAGVQLFWRTSPNQLILEKTSAGTGTNGTDAFFYDRDDDIFYFNGRVGIDTTVPAVALHINGSVRGNQSGALRISTGNGYVDVGPKNTSWCHFYTDRPRFYFDKPVVVNNGFISSYDENLQIKADWDNTATNYQLYLTTAGRVGVKTSSPEADLDVEGSTKVNSLIVGDPGSFGSETILHSEEFSSGLGSFSDGSVCGSASAWSASSGVASCSDNVIAYPDGGSETERSVRILTGPRWVLDSGYGNFKIKVRHKSTLSTTGLSSEAKGSGEIWYRANTGSGWSSWQVVPRSAYVSGAPTVTTITTCNSAYNTNYLTQSSYTVSEISLSSLGLSEGDSIQIRLAFVCDLYADDGGAGGSGGDASAEWEVDYVRLTGQPCTEATFEDGVIKAEGAVYSNLGSCTGDVAEFMPAVAGVEPGDLLAVNSDGVLEPATSANAENLVGVYSSTPSVLVNSPGEGIPVALTGRAYVKVTSENGSIKIGDPITASSKPGYGAKATGKSFVIGKALENLEDGDGKILVMIQPGWYLPAESDNEVILASGDNSAMGGKKIVTVYDDRVRKNSHIYLTFRTDPGSRWWIPVIEDGYFQIEFADKLMKNVVFYYLIETKD